MPLRHISHVGCLDTTYTELFHTQCSCADSLVLESKGRTGHVADFKIQSLALPESFLECVQVHLSCRVLGLLAWEPLWVPDQPLPFHCCISPSWDGPASLHPSIPSACTFCALVSGCSLEVKGPLLPSLASPLLPHRPLFLAQFIGRWGGNSLGSGSRWEREGKAKNHSGSHIDLYSVLYLPLIL